MTQPNPAAADEATRYLASAVHLDDRLADDLIGEFLTEPRRAIPPSPGVNSEVVLREAVTARARRVLVAAVVLALLGTLVGIGSYLVVAWLASALAWRLSSVVVTVGATWMLRNIETPPQFPRWLHWWLTYLLWGSVTWVFLIVALSPLLVSGQRTSADPSELLFALSLIVQALIFGVLLTEKLMRQHVVDQWYRFGNYVPGTPPRDTVVRSCGPYANRLRRFAEADARTGQHSPAEFVVFRGLNPFVGAGIHLEKWSWSTTLELYPADPGANGGVPTFTPMELQDFVTKDLMALRETSTLTPGWRFSDLHIAHWALLDSGHLLHYPDAAPLLQQLEAGMNPQMLPEYWAGLMNSSPEWLRYFRCYRVEGWERQLAVSTFLHVGCQQRTLMLECQSFVLPPIDPAYRTVDRRRLPVLPELWQTLCEFALLPTTIPARIGTIWRWLRDQARVGGSAWRSPGEAAIAFGAECSVRELGSGDAFNNFFEVTDKERYLLILRERIFDAVSRFLTEKGISTTDFERSVTQISNATYINNSNVVANNIGGSNNRGVMNGATMPVSSPAAPSR
ncbi:hypothetical protein AB0N05_17910 [Nocardia sp. NPDC051030]|uniref:hypothetical protein n=1 Tax=Nocardia sp. NPDC051030 TaxID=3155162 RepID=UPI0034471FF2